MRLFLGSNPQAISSHSHPVIQFVAGRREEFRTLGKDGKWKRVRGLLIRPNHQHQCDAAGIEIFSLDLEPDSLLGERLVSLFPEGVSMLNYPSGQFPELDFQAIQTSLDIGDIAGLRNYILNYFRINDLGSRLERDDRIQAVTDFIHQNIHQELTTNILAGVACLSESRLLHLFKEEMGLPIRNYILWYRTKIVLNQILEGKNLTEAAHIAGFSDQAHLSRTSVRMLGIPPSLISKNSKFVQVSFPD